MNEYVIQGVKFDKKSYDEYGWPLVAKFDNQFNHVFDKKIISFDNFK